jgi:cyclic-di-GMP phosphodiesterase TipF (flagellum assembly factor)
MMTASIRDSRLGIPAHCRESAGNAFVLLAMTVVTIAFGLGLHLQVGLAAWLAVVLALSVLIALASGHVSMRRSETQAKLYHKIARLEGELAVLKRGSADAVADDPHPPANQSHARAPQALSERQSVPQGAVSAPLAFSAPSAAPHAAQATPAGTAAATPRAGPPPLNRPQFGGEHLMADPQVPAPGPTRKVDAGATPNIGIPRATAAVYPDRTSRPATAREAVPDLAAGYWRFRPAKTARADEYAASAAFDPTSPPAAAVPPKNPEATETLSDQSIPALADGSAGSRMPGMPLMPKPGAASDADVEHIHGVIKKLAEELRAAKSAPGPQLHDSVRPSPVTGEAAFAAPGQVLKTAGQAVRDESGAPAVAVDPADTSRKTNACRADVQAGLAPLCGAPAHARLAEIASAVTAARLDVYLEPILGLPDLRARHYEVSVRLRSETGASIAPEEFNLVARGTGLLPLIDAMRVSRSGKVALHLRDRGAAGSLFSQISGESLASNRLLREFTDTYHQSETIAERLVLSFAQSDVRGFAAPQWATLKELLDLGFRFALEDISDLDMDFEALTAAGFAFAKFDARVFLEGLPAQGGLIPAADLCRYLAHLGLTLIVGRIDDEAQLGKVLGFGALFGQGTLFGAPRPVKAEVLRGAQGVAA